MFFQHKKTYFLQNTNFYIKILYIVALGLHRLILFPMFSMETRIVNMKVVVNDFGSEVYIIIRPETIPSNIVESTINVCNLS
jgi:hypothetical protein